MEYDTVVVVAGGNADCAGAFRGTLPETRPVIAADGGADLARALGLHVDVVVGDLDSVSAAGLASAEAAGARVLRYPREKDATDLELALDEAVALGARRVVVIGPGGGRFDHLIAGLLLLGADKYARTEIDAIAGSARLHVVRGVRELAGTAGELVSLLALHRAAEGVTTEGLRYPLRGETLEPGSSRGVSNVFDAATARVSLERGVLLAIRPAADP